ncbi:MAG TPA: hypothetical protein VJQ52_20425 [Steroidobacteraceae bacterium]|nr:hypothetical protein [Steroidobacteraceae bacterium]
MLIAGLVKVIVKVVVVAAIVLLSLIVLGDYLRPLVPEQHHRAVWKAGLFIFFPCAAGFVLMSQPFALELRRFQNLFAAGAIVGAVLFMLFISDIECELIPRARGGMSLHCEYLEEP